MRVFHLAGTSSGPCSAFPEPARPQSLATWLTRPRLAHQCNHGREPTSRHCGTGIGPDRDITGGWRDVGEPCASLPAVPPGQAGAPRGNCRLFDTGTRNPARDGLSAGGRWIRTCSTAAREPIAMALRPPAADRDLARAGRSPGLTVSSVRLGARRDPRRPGRSPGWRAWRRGLDTGRLSRGLELLE